MHHNAHEHDLSTHVPVNQRSLYLASCIVHEVRCQGHCWPCCCYDCSHYWLPLLRPLPPPPLTSASSSSLPSSFHKLHQCYMERPGLVQFLGFKGFGVALLKLHRIFSFHHGGARLRFQDDFCGRVWKLNGSRPNVGLESKAGLQTWPVLQLQIQCRLAWIS